MTIPSLLEGRSYILEAVVESVKEEDRLSVISFNDCIFRMHDENILVEDSLVATAVPECVGTTITKVNRYLPLDITGKPESFLIHYIHGEVRIQAVSQANTVFERLTNNYQQLESDIDQGINIRDLSKSIGNDIRFLKTNAFKFPHIAVDMGKNDIISAVTNIEVMWRMAVSSNTELLRSEKSFHHCDLEVQSKLLESSVTERQGLRQLYLDHIKKNGETPLFCLVSGTIDEIQPDVIGLNTRIIFTGVTLREYDINTPFDQSPVIESLSHINSFVDPSVASILKPGEEGTWLGRVVNYQRSRPNESGDMFDVSVRIVKFADVDSWVQKFHAAITDWKSHLELEGTTNSGKKHKLAREIRKLLGSEFIPINTQKTTWSQAKKSMDAAEAEYQNVWHYNEKLQEEARQESAGLKRLHDLTLEALLHMNDKFDGSPPKDWVMGHKPYT